MLLLVLIITVNSAIPPGRLSRDYGPLSAEWRQRQRYLLYKLQSRESGEAGKASAIRLHIMLIQETEL